VPPAARLAQDADLRAYSTHRFHDAGGDDLGLGAGALPCQKYRHRVYSYTCIKP
jgi:hypothetical protein